MWSCCRIFALVVAFVASPAFAQREFGFDNTKASGQPYLKPQETVQRMKVANGFEVKLFAAEPMVVNPIAMTVDEKGRVWVIECFEYPKRTPKGKMPRDRIIILEDTDGDGVADKRTVFAEGKDFPERFDMASGLEVGHGGVFVGAPPFLWFIENKNDKPGKFTKLLSGFGSQDTHETLNTFQWGPDGRLYGLHGVFTHSEVQQPDAQARAVRMNAAVWRYDVRTKKFEIFAEGTSNPWGMDWRNTDGQFILCCCVIPHLYHIVPGGIYQRQAGQSFNPYAYSYLKEICDHTFHKKSGWAHAGLISLDTPLMPKEYRDSVIFGSIHGCSIKRNVLKPNGSTFIASEAEDFLVSGDKNFRPINLRWGHNGEIYCIDWHDQHPCHQTKPDDWDYERGRVYRIQPKGLKTKKAEDLGGLPVHELQTMLANNNPWNSRTAARLLAERRTELKPADVNNLRGMVTYYSMLALATLAATERLDEGLAGGFLNQFQAMEAREPTLRAWTVRLLAESGAVSEAMWLRLLSMAKDEQSPEVRLQLVNAAEQLAAKRDVKPLLHALMQHKDNVKDPIIPQLLWQAYEPFLAANPKGELNWIKQNTSDNLLIPDFVLPRAMRRLVAANKAERLEACIAFIGDLKDAHARRLALEGLEEALKDQLVDAPPSWKSVAAGLIKTGDPRVVQLTNRLAVSFRDPEAVARALKAAQDASRGVPDRLAAIRDLGLTRPSAAQKVLQSILLEEKNAELRAGACRALSAFDSPDLAGAVLAGWKSFPSQVKIEVVNLLAGRRNWAKDLLAAVGKGTVARSDLHDNHILRIHSFKDMTLNEQIEKVWGRFRDTPAELNTLIDKMRKELDSGPASFARGKLVFDNQCAKCHKFDGRGHEVGPPLDGAGRDIEYLLANILDPNRVVGQPYYTRIVETKDGRIETGLLHAEDDNAITLKVENSALKVIQKKDIEGKVQVHSKSVMPEGLANNMTVQDFRDLVRYTMAHPFITEVALGEVIPRKKPLDRLNDPLMKRIVVGASGRIALPKAVKDDKKIMLITAEVFVPENMDARLMIGGNVNLRVAVKEANVYVGMPGKGAARADMVEVDVVLIPGSNRIIVSTTYEDVAEPAVYLRFLDPDRKLRYPDRGIAVGK